MLAEVNLPPLLRPLPLLLPPLSLLEGVGRGSGLVALASTADTCTGDDASLAARRTLRRAVSRAVGLRSTRVRRLHFVADVEVALAHGRLEEWEEHLVC